VKRAYFSRTPSATNCADGTCSSIIEIRPYSDTEHCGYHLPQPRQVSLRCPSANGWTSRTKTLSDPGVILNSSKCTISTSELRTLPELHGEIQSTIDTAHFYIPESNAVIANHEIPLIKEMSPGEVKQLDEVK
jgi:hypothetical protein